MLITGDRSRTEKGGSREIKAREAGCSDPPVSSHPLTFHHGCFCLVQNYKIFKVLRSVVAPFYFPSNCHERKIRKPSLKNVVLSSLNFTSLSRKFQCAGVLEDVLKTDLNVSQQSAKYCQLTFLKLKDSHCDSNNKRKFHGERCSIPD